MKFKGRVEPTVMRKRKADGDANDGAKKDSNKENDPLSKFPYPYEQNVTSEELANKKAKEVSSIMMQNFDKIYIDIYSIYQSHKWMQNLYHIYCINKSCICICLPYIETVPVK